jgi:L-aspartate oxidase
VPARLSSDFLVIGSGIAGLRAAVALASAGRVTVLTKATPRAGSTDFAQGGIAAAVGPDDSPALHAADTRGAGDGLCDPAAVDILVTDGPRYVQELVAWGAAFDRAPDGSLDLAREGAHSVRRVLHARDATGREIGRVLASRAVGHPNVSVLDHALACQLIVADGGVAGARFLDGAGQLGEVRARATLIATGGAGQVYRETTNPDVATGDGVTLAYLAGARVVDLEFVQFHPTVLAVPGAPRYLLSEALRGEGARLINADGEPFMSREEPLGDLAPRARVARAILRETERTGRPVSLTLAHLPAGSVRARFPLIDSLCRRAGLDLTIDPLPVSPAAHYLMGGIATDVDGRTSLPGLFAAGEAACTGVHGANRLASNSLLEGLVFGGRAAAAMRAWDGSGWPAGSTDAIEEPPGWMPVPDGLTEDQLREAMWRHAGVFRQRAGLEDVLARLDEALPSAAGVSPRAAPTAASWRLASLATVGRLIVRAALRREESRGAHWRRDFPERDDLHWGRHVDDRRGA